MRALPHALSFPSEVRVPGRVEALPHRPAEEPGTLDGVHRLLERLFREVSRTSPSAPEPALSDPGSAQILLDVERDGFRITVIREPVKGRPRMVLSPREYEVARMVARGYPNKTIASVLEISSWTVSTHLRRIFAKLDVTSRAAMVAKLLEAGVLGAQGPPLGS